MEITIIIILAVLNIILGYACYNLVKQVEDMEDYNRGLEEYILFIKDKITSAYSTIKKADYKGSFEADDEVGSIFKDIKEVINFLEILFTDTDNDAKKS